ncbi:PREDICTED: endonuclease G, mitochondrial [Dufourea novaeangliae]|uniref:Endonuclease n=1 Tax=Dufourea novaeangliae TaxID=178035 RepID=A0A154PKU9_DUFNO|nr:PREDICTED: endonuclease G, mitochondrial [Dufourea novaeangliae]KZC11918.1 Endonuclease G, mitochondrial [Dufourea novaeangliae]
MKGLTRIVLKMTALTTVGLGGWYIGKYSEEKKHLNEEEYCRTSILSDINIKRMPGLPLFGKVSAATTFVPAETGTDMGSKLSSTASRVSEIMKYGFPGLDHVRSYEDFVLSYDRRNRIAHWVFEHLNKDRLQYNSEISRTKCEFQPDPSIHPYFRSDNSDYKGSGYDRGHLAAAGNHKVHQHHVDQTFYLTNMAPQVGRGFNRDSWNRLEKYVRGLTKVYKDVYVCTGPLYLPKKEADGKKYVRYEVIGTNHVAVPTHFYKIVVGETHDLKLEMEAFVMPNAPINENTPLTNFQVPPESIERAAGLLFFDKISRDKLSKVNGKKIGWS